MPLARILVSHFVMTYDLFDLLTLQREKYGDFVHLNVHTTKKLKDSLLNCEIKRAQGK